MTRRLLLLLAAFAAAFTVTAQERYPARNIDMIVPWGPGGGADVLGRVIA